MTQVHEKMAGYEISFAKVRALYLACYHVEMPGDLSYADAASDIWTKVFHWDGEAMSAYADRIYCPGYTKRGGQLLHQWNIHNYCLGCGEVISS